MGRPDDTDDRVDGVIDEAFDLINAPTVAPKSTAAGSASDALWSGETIDAASSGDARATLPTGPELPVVDADRYIAEREVARGGMGRIIAARDRRLARPVALKELLVHGHEHAAQAARFRREALITARLQHPAIVPVYEAGTWPGGEPFFAMKLVAGRPLDKVIGDQKTMEARLALLPAVIAATDAIAYAHTQRVVHRDLKPSNVLVGDFGETVVIDWGLAKDLDAGDDSQPPTTAGGSGTSTGDPAASGLTLAGAVMGTPAYMPPEQARGESVDERADVFALGAMLYHLLAGAPPYHARTAGEVVEAAMKGAVVPLRQRAPRAAPDLQAIVARAMAADPADRYPSARELADELRRFQTGQLVGAHRYSTRERIARFVRRHRAAVTIGAGSAVLFLVLGTLAIQRIVAERDGAMEARRVADTRRAAAEKLVDYVTRDLRTRLEPMGRVDLLAGLGAGALAYYDALGGLGLGADDVDRRAIALDLVAEAAKDRGDLDGALATWSRAQRELEAIVAARPEDRGSPENRARRRHAADAAIGQGGIHQARGKTHDAVTAFDAGIAAYDQLLREAPDDDELALGAATAHDRLGDLYRPRGDTDLALDQFRTALELRERVMKRRPADRDVQDVVAHSHHEVGTAYIGGGESARALDELTTAADMLRALVTADAGNSRYQAHLAAVETEMAGFQRQIGALDESVATFRATLPVVQALVKRDPLNTQWRRDLGNLESELGFALLDEGDAHAALDRFTAAIDNHEALLALQPDDTRWLVDLSRTYGRRGDARLALGDIDAAIADFTKARDQREGLLARDRGNPVWRRTAAWGYHKLATGLAERHGPGDLDAAIALYERALALRTQLVKDVAHQAPIQDELGQSQLLLGGLLIDRGGAGDVDRGLALLDAAIASAQAMVDADPVDAAWKQTLVRGLTRRGDAYRRRGDHARAIADLERAVQAAATAAQKAPASAEWQAQLAIAHWGLARCLHGQPGPARDEARATSELGAARDLLARLAQRQRLSAEYRGLDAQVRGGL